jgi:hypothetical protein
MFATRIWVSHDKSTSDNRLYEDELRRFARAHPQQPKIMVLSRSVVRCDGFIKWLNNCESILLLDHAAFEKEEKWCKYHIAIVHVNDDEILLEVIVKFWAAAKVISGLLPVNLRLIVNFKISVLANLKTS